MKNLFIVKVIFIFLFFISLDLAVIAQSVRDTAARNEYGQLMVKLNDTYYPQPMNFEEDDLDSDFINAKRGYVVGSKLEENIDNSAGGAAWEMPSFYFINGKSPKSVHKNLWRMEKLNNINGLFLVLPKVEGDATKKSIKNGTIFQVRSYDLATMSIVKGENGWIIVDPLQGNQTAIAAWETFKRHVDSKAKISAIIITHSHVDHYKGAAGLLESQNLEIAKVTQEELEGGKYEYNANEALLIAPKGFYDESISENLYLGTCMGRRAAYMYGRFLPKSQFGTVGSGLGKSVSIQQGIIPVPSFEVEAEEIEGVRLANFKVDGLDVVFQDVPGTEAPAEFHLYFKEYKALCPGENLSQTLHNLLTPRGAKVRDPKAFAQAIDASMTLFPDVEVIIGTHHWPTWNETGENGDKILKCLEYMEKQRDVYYYFNNQVIYLLNCGYNMEEIAELFSLPASLREEFYNRGYYGTMNHDAKAVAQRYIGWWDGNPANYYKHTEVNAAKRFVADMGGEERVLERAKEYFDKGDYRWAIELTKNIVFANPSNESAKELEADAMEQLAYSFEAGTWRNIFLSGAFELRGYPQGVKNSYEQGLMAMAYNMRSLSAKYIFEYLSVLINGDRVDGVELYTTCKIGEESFRLWLKNGVFHYKLDSSITDADSKFENVDEFVKVFVSYKAPNAEERVSIDSNLAKIFSYVEILNNRWNIIEPIE